MPKFKPNVKVRVRLDAEDAPEEVRGEEGIVTTLNLSHFVFRSPGSSYGTVDDGAVIWYVCFPELGKTLPLNEVFLDPV